MINIAEKHNCCGCGACAQACVKNCITMTADEEGFLYPKVDLTHCFDCHLCEKACPLLQEKPQEQMQPELFASYALNPELRKKSSSGGVFSLLADWILSKGGVVFGAAFDEDFSVHQVMAENLDQLAALRGSKYLQSRTEETYLQAKQQLQLGKKVLYTGTACQIAGLKSYLGADDPNLYTVDVLCHGVPSPKIWKRYLREQECAHDAKVSAVNFRKKVPSWKRYSVEINFDNGKQYRKSVEEDAFMQCFLGDICLRPSCHVCKYRGVPRVSDLTIGDAWGIWKHMPQMDDDRGTSVVVVHTEKGRNLWGAICDGMTCQQGSAAALLSGNPSFWHCSKPHPQRNQFFMEANSGASMEQLKKYVQKSFGQKIWSLAKRCVKKVLCIVR